MLWRIHNILPSQDGCAGGHWKVGLINLKIDPTILGCFARVVLLNEFLRDIQELDAHIFGSLHWGLEVKVFKIKGNKARVATQQNTVNDKFDEVE